MRNVTHNSITIILVISILFFFSQKYPLKDEVNFKKKIIEFITAEDSREIKKILTYYQFPILNYWNEKNLSKNNLKEIYRSSWNKNEYSKNQVQNIKEISKYQYLLTTNYNYTKSLKSENINSILSDIQFTFNEDGKITSIKNSSVRKITKDDILNYNYINELNEKEDFLSKNSLFVKSSLIILLILNLILQVLFNIKKLISKKKSSNTNSAKEQELKSNKYNYKDLKYEEQFNKLLKEEEDKKKQESTKYHYKKLNHEKKFNQKTEEEKEINENIIRQNANRKIRQEEEIRIKKEENIRKQNVAAAKNLEEEIRVQKEENIRKRNAAEKRRKEEIRKQNVVTAKKIEEEKTRKEKEELENLRKQVEKIRKRNIAAAKKIEEEKIRKEKVKTFDIKRVNYSTSLINTSINQYPIVRKPLFYTVIRSFRLGRNNRKGYKENDLYQAIQKHFNKDFDVLDNTMLAIGSGTNPYEPDIAMISKGTKNIYIDIEIDEPYAGVSRKLTHCYLEDVNRDNYFVDRGWFVIRFSEYQVHHQLEECLHKIVKVLSCIDDHFIKHKFFHHNYMFIDMENSWRKNQAQIWEQTNYREKYLNHNFKPFIEIKRKIKTKLTKEEQIEENLAKPRAHSTINKTNTPPEHQTYKEKKVVEPKVTYQQKEFNSNNYSMAFLIEKAIDKASAIEMNYTNKKMESSTRKVSELEYTDEFLKYGYEKEHFFKGYCHKNQEERSFRISRINYMKILN
jgi:hypothetical protein